MPKIMLRNTTETKSETNNTLSLTKPVEKTKTTVDTLTLQRILRKKRSQKYMEAMKSLDAGGHVHNKKEVNEIINTIKSELPDVDINGILLGFVAKCYLGAPYEAHTLDLVGEIIEHYKRGETLPGGLDKAKSIALHGGYDFIEVYTDCCRAISSNGSVSVIKD